MLFNPADPFNLEALVFTRGRVGISGRREEEVRAVAERAQRNRAGENPGSGRSGPGRADQDVPWLQHEGAGREIGRAHV